jgi:hypothetical protein
VPLIFAAGLAAWLVAALLRYRLVEYEPAWTACADSGGPWWCTVRTAVNWTIGNRAFEILSVLAGGVAALGRSAALAYLALVAGVVGAVLYRFDFSAIGIIAGALVLVSLRSRT